jgi:hypothetical protein
MNKAGNPISVGYDSLYELSRALLYMYTAVNMEARVIASRHGYHNLGERSAWGQKARTNGNVDFSPDVK